MLLTNSLLLLILRNLLDLLLRLSRSHRLDCASPQGQFLDILLVLADLGVSLEFLFVNQIDGLDYLKESLTVLEVCFDEIG